jgi:hypothetical protein
LGVRFTVECVFDDIFEMTLTMTWKGTSKLHIDLKAFFQFVLIMLTDKHQCNSLKRGLHIPHLPRPEETVTTDAQD